MSKVTVDILILGQVWMYRLNTEKRKRSELGRQLWQEAGEEVVDVGDTCTLLSPAPAPAEDDAADMEIVWEDFILDSDKK